MVWVSRHAWSLEIVENLARFTNLRVILAQVLWQSSLYRSNFNISVPVANSMTKLYTWIDKSLSLARQPLLVVTLNYRSFATRSQLPGYSVRCRQQVLARCNFSRPTEIYTKPYIQAVLRGCVCTHGHLRLLKIWNTSRICVPTLRRGHANLLHIVQFLIYLLP